MRFKSPNTGEYVAAHQYIAEIIVRRKADYNKDTLPSKYWNDKESKYYKEYRSQVQQAGKLIKKYSPLAITKSLEKLKWCYSLMNKTLLEEIKVQQKILEEQEKTPVKDIEISSNTEQRKTFSKNKLDRFR